jgi:NAD+ diphosphatase
MKILFAPKYISVLDSKAMCFLCTGSRMAVVEKGDTTNVPLLADIEKAGLLPYEVLFLGMIGDIACYGIEIVSEMQLPQGMKMKELRNLFTDLKPKTFEMALTASHLVHWNASYKYCGSCKGDLIPDKETRAKKCIQCGRLEFPRISPAVIVLVEREGRILLGRSPRFAGEFYSVLAGFVEPGESLEDTVRREIMEEVGISVKEITYFGSQPWPFPDSLMLGFTAQYESGEIIVDGEEILDANWFLPDELPKIPGKISIARKLIDWYIEKHAIRNRM